MRCNTGVGVALRDRKNAREDRHMPLPSRINVVGTSGSGKSTFARRLAQAMNCAHVEMDKVFWEPNWTQPKDEVFLARLRGAIEGDRWVLDGNYTRSVPVKWERAEMVIWLDYSFTRTLYQAVKRAIGRSLSQEELWEGTGNRESFGKLFSRDSIIMWTINTHASNRAKYEACLSDSRFAHIKFVRLRDHREADEFLRVALMSNSKSDYL